MNSPKIQFIVGLFVIAGLAAVIYLSIRIGGVNLIRGETYSLSARFTNASGLHTGSNVTLAGVRIGQVTRITLDPEDMVAMVEFRIPADLKLDDDTIAAIRSSGIIGEKFITLQPGGSGMYLEPGDVIIDTSSSIDLEDLIARFAFGSVDD